MEPHFLLLWALGEDIIHQALSRAERFLFTQPTVLFHSLPWLPLTLCSSLCPIPTCHSILHIIRAHGRQKQGIKDGYCLCAPLYTERNNVIKLQGRESREEKETAGFKKFSKLPQGRHLLVYVGNSRMDHLLFSLYGANRISYLIPFIDIFSSVPFIVIM